ncbi:hypothetical protein [Ornithinibacillus xuwenensis]|uniref:Uncharacterized protein n=1 Tax=Ornithinibacillus xuwenensis TaxID=3144668 RepID=A0ABU9XLA7_9BACI
MKRINFYKKVSTELLGCFYCFTLDKIEKQMNVSNMLYENSLIEKVAKERGISLIELRIIGYWIIQKERNLIKDELE